MRNLRAGAVWCLAIVVCLWLVPIGVVSGDGIAQSASYLAGQWRLNPNHLLYEPLGAWWVNSLIGLFPGRSGPDVLKLLSILSGGIAVGLFRWLVAPRIAGGVAGGALLATGWFALGAGFLTHLVSDEVHMVQMPWLVLLAAATLHAAGRPGLRSGVGLGLAGGIAALFYISNVLIVGAVTIALLVPAWRRGSGTAAVRLAAGIAGALALSFGGGLMLAWLRSGPARPDFVAWLTSYGGTGGSSRVAAAYGLQGGLRGLAVSALKSVLGTTSAAVDQEVLVGHLRGEFHRPWSAAAGAAVALLAGAWLLRGAILMMRRPEDHPASDRRLLAACWTVGVLAFAIYWNNSDGQFFFQLSLAFACLAASAAQHSRRAVTLAVATAVLGWNAAWFLREQVLFPRERLVAELARVTTGADLVLLPGQDQIDQMLHFVPPGGTTRRSVTSFAERVPAEAGLAELDSLVTRTLAAGGRVVAVGIVAANPLANPWRFLESLGYRQPEVERALLRGRIVRADSAGRYRAAWIEARP